MQFLWRMSLFLELLRVLCVMGKYRLIWLSLEEIVLEMSLNFDLITAVRTCYLRNADRMFVFF